MSLAEGAQTSRQEKMVSLYVRQNQTFKPRIQRQAADWEKWCQVRVSQDRKDTVGLPTTVGHFGKQCTAHTSKLPAGKLECVHPTPVRNWCRAAVWMWGVGWIGMQIAGRHSFPGSSSLERWLEIRLACADTVRGHQQHWSSGTGTTRKGWRS